MFLETDVYSMHNYNYDNNIFIIILLYLYIIIINCVILYLNNEPVHNRYRYILKDQRIKQNVINYCFIY